MPLSLGNPGLHAPIEALVKKPELSLSPDLANLLRVSIADFTPYIYYVAAAAVAVLALYCFYKGYKHFTMTDEEKAKLHEEKRSRHARNHDDKELQGVVNVTL